MKRTDLLPLLGLLAAFAGGCQQDFYARRIIEHETGAQALMMNLGHPSGQRMVQLGRIDDHRVVKAPDGTELDVWVLKARSDAVSTKGAVVVLHGLTDSKGIHPYYGTAKRLEAMGYDAVLVDLRAHGRSGGRYVTCGAKEKLDVKAVMDELIAARLISEKVIAFGYNLGASTAIQYAAIDARVQGVVAVAPDKDCRSMALRLLAAEAPFMSNAKFDAIVARAGKIADFDPTEASAIAAARKLKCPLLIVHGDLEVWIPRESSRAVYDAATCPKRYDAMSGVELAALEENLARRIDEVATGKVR